MQNYRDLKVWERAHELTLAIYEITKAYPKEEIYGLVSQLRRASSSIPANIAEGCGKKSKAEFVNFLHISLGSANEVEYFLILSKDIGYIGQVHFEELFKLINEVKAMLIVFINKVKV